jgi:hypothetical protein
MWGANGFLFRNTGGTGYILLGGIKHMKIMKTLGILGYWARKFRDFFLGDLQWINGRPLEFQTFRHNLCGFFWDGHLEEIHGQKKPPMCYPG